MKQVETGTLIALIMVSIVPIFVFALTIFVLAKLPKEERKQEIKKLTWPLVFSAVTLAALFSWIYKLFF